MSECNDCNCGMEPGSVVLNELHIVEYMSPDGTIWKMDFSSGGDNESDLATGKYFELAQWALMMAQAPILAEMIEAYRAA